MPKKNYFDFSLFDEVGDAMDLFANTIRKSFKYDSFEGLYEFDAIVLTHPIPMTLSEIDVFLKKKKIVLLKILFLILIKYQSFHLKLGLLVQILHIFSCLIRVI